MCRPIINITKRPSRLSLPTQAHLISPTRLLRLDTRLADSILEQSAPRVRVLIMRSTLYSFSKHCLTFKSSVLSRPPLVRFNAFGRRIPLLFSLQLVKFSEKARSYIESSNRSKEYYIFVNINGKMKRLSFGKSFKKTHKAGDRIQLCVVTGLLGYQYVTMDTNSKFKPNDF